MTLTTVPSFVVERARASKLQDLATAITERTPVSGYASAATTVNNSTTLVNVTGLSVAVVANATYHFELYLPYSTNSTADIKLGWTFPTGLTMLWGGVGYSTAEAVLVFGGQTQATNPGFGAGTGLTLIGVGSVFVGSTAGTLQLQMAQNTMNASNTTVSIGARLTLWRVD